MQLTEPQVRTLIRRVLIERREVVLPNGRTVAYGSKSHIAYLDKLLNQLHHERNSYRRDSSTRADYSRAVTRTKKRLSQANAYAEKHGLNESRLKYRVSIDVEGPSGKERLNIPIEARQKRALDKLKKRQEFWSNLLKPYGYIVDEAGDHEITFPGEKEGYLWDEDSPWYQPLSLKVSKVGE